MYCAGETVHEILYLDYDGGAQLPVAWAMRFFCGCTKFFSDCCSFYPYMVGPDSVVGVATRYALNGPGIESRRMLDFELTS